MQPKHCSHSFPITRSTWGSSQKNWAGHALISTNMPQPKKRYSLRSTVALIVLWSMILWLRLQARSSQMLNLRMSGHVPVARHPEFLRYQSILIPIIETNTSLDRLVEFKKNFALMNESIRTLLRKHLSCSANEASDLSLCLIYQAAALFNHFNCAEQVAEAMRLAGLPPIEGNFEDAYTSFVEMCLDRLSQ